MKLVSTTQFRRKQELQEVLKFSIEIFWNFTFTTRFTGTLSIITTMTWFTGTLSIITTTTWFTGTLSIITTTTWFTGTYQSLQQ